MTASKYKLGVITQESVAKDVDGSTSVYWKEKSLFTYDTCFRPLTEKKYVGPSNVFSGGSLDANNLCGRARQLDELVARWLLSTDDAERHDNGEQGTPAHHVH